jgi:hypothetical protein
MTSYEIRAAIGSAVGGAFLGIAVITAAQAENADRFAMEFADAQYLCDQFFLPSSMARTLNFDPQRQMQELDARLHRFADLFRSPAGLGYLREQQAKGADSFRAACAARLLEFATASPANPVSPPTPREGAAER